MSITLGNPKTVDIGLKDASGKVQRRLEEVAKLKQKWERIFQGPYQRARTAEEAEEKYGKTLDTLRSEILRINKEIRTYGTGIRDCAELLISYGERAEDRYYFELWKPEEEFAVRKCGELLRKMGE